MELKLVCSGENRGFTVLMEYTERGRQRREKEDENNHMHLRKVYHIPIGRHFMS
jgi:hypothetical protein